MGVTAPVHRVVQDVVEPAQLEGLALVVAEPESSSTRAPVIFGTTAENTSVSGTVLTCTSR